jgi:hypothetical protein
LREWQGSIIHTGGYLQNNVLGGNGGKRYTREEKQSFVEEEVDGESREIGSIDGKEATELQIWKIMEGGVQARKQKNVIPRNGKVEK